jgi:hypothetical protein
MDLINRLNICMTSSNHAHGENMVVAWILRQYLSFKLTNDYPNLEHVQH